MSSFSLRAFSAGASIAAISLALAAPSAAFAQATTTQEDVENEDSVPDTAIGQDLDTSADSEDEAIVVTGTRIRRPDLESATPITSFDDQSIVLSGRTNLTDFLTQTPALIGSSDSNSNAGSNAGIGFTGLNLLNLRNLGTNRTLVLVDGRRHVSAVPGSASVDVNTIPTDLVQRIDVVTGGASAIYGADGVSGVVNFILKRDFEGITARGQAGISSRGDAGNRFVAVTAGQNFADDRGNVAIAYEYNKDDRLFSQERSRYRAANRDVLVLNPAEEGADDPNVPDRIFLNDIRFFDSSRAGAIDVDFDGLPEFNADGSPFDPGRFVPNFNQQGGDGTPTSDFIGDLLPEIERHSVNALFRFALTDKINFFAQGKYVNTKSFSISQPTFDFFILLQPDNPFLPANLRQIAINNIDDIGIGGVLVNRDNFDLGSRGEDIERETIRSVVGFDGDINENARFEVSYVYGQSKAKNFRSGNRFNDRFFAAIDAVVDPATGRVTCRSNLNPNAEPDQPFSSSSFPGFLSFTPGPNSGCAPLNILGEGSPSQAAIDFVTVRSLDTSTVKQHVANASIDGDFGTLLALPGGEIGYALGAEWRRETSQSTPAAEDTSGATFGNIIFPSKGDFEVKEVFAELNVPVLRDVPFAHRLEFAAAVRLSDYTTIGNTTTYKLDAVYAPIPDITFRGTYAQAVRAPNIGELFDPASQTFQFINDPCDASNQTSGESVRVANCAALLSAAGVANPATFNDTNSSSIAGLSNGNVNLSEEEAKTKTLGVVLRPRFLRGFTAAVDGYDIKLKDAINQVSAQQLANLCVDQATIDNIFCDAITRQTGGAQAGRINGFILQPENVANFRTRGIDFTLNYRYDAGTIGVINARLVGGYLDKLTFIGSPGAAETDSRDLPGAPKWIVNFDLTYAKGPLTVNYGFNYFNGVRRFARVTTEANPDIVADDLLRFKPKQEHDLTFSFDVDKSFNFYAGVNNLLDQQPSRGQTFFPVSTVGRFFFAGARVRFGSIL